MAGFDILELFLYVFPILEVVTVYYFFQPFLRYRNRIRLSVTDVTLPILLLGIHILSVRLLTFSLLPHFLFVGFVSGLILTVVMEHGKKERTAGQVFYFFLKILFLLGFVAHYALVIARMLQITRG